MKLINDDCLKVLPTLANQSIDLVLTDPPYGTTVCKWDSVIPFDLMWLNLKRIIKDNGCIVLFSKQPFTSNLISSNFENYKYSIIWKKDNHDNPLMAKKRFLNITEDINLFYKKQCLYNPQGIIKFNRKTKQGRGRSLSQKNDRNLEYYQEYTNYPKNILEFKRDKGLHPTQKPVALLEYLIKTYTNQNDTVLDFTMGSGSTGVACKNLSRDFIGIELDKDYYKIAKQRVGVLN